MSERCCGRTLAAKTLCPQLYAAVLRYRLTVNAQRCADSPEEWPDAT
jgi:hypothetical protein